MGARLEEVAGMFRKAPFVAELGVEAEAMGEGRCESRLQLGERHLQHDGYVHAGVIASMADHSAGAAATTLVKDGHIVLTAEFKISLLRAARGDCLRCVAVVIKPGSRITFAEAEVHCETGTTARLVAKASVSLAVVPDPRLGDDSRGAAG